MAVCDVWIDLQIRPIGRICGLPLVFVALKLPAVANKWRFGGQGQHLSFLADPVVVHALGILGVTHQARHIQAAINLKLVAHDADHGNVFARPIAFLKNFVAVDLAVLDLLAVSLAAALGLAVDGF